MVRTKSAIVTCGSINLHCISDAWVYRDRSTGGGHPFAPGNSCSNDAVTVAPPHVPACLTSEICTGSCCYP